jgi:hypothetical protein
LKTSMASWYLFLSNRLTPDPFNATAALYKW